MEEPESLFSKIQKRIYGPSSIRKARDERDEAIERADRGAAEQWKNAAIDLIRQMPAGKTFTADDIWFQLSDISNPREPRALGPVILSAVKKKIIRKTGEYRQAVRRHATPGPVWIRQ